MRTWKALLGVGVACAACCAIPLLGGAAALTAASATLIALAMELAACADELVPLAGGLLVLGLATLGGWLVWRRRRTPVRACGCAPGTCA